MRLFHLRGIVALSVMTVGLGQQGVFAQMPKDEPMVNWAKDRKFEHLPILPDCLTISVVHGDPASGPSEVLGKSTPGCVIPWHWHGPNESLLVISGAGENQTRSEKAYAMHRGDFAYLPSHRQHRGMCRDPETCLTFLYSDAPADVHWIDVSGKEVTWAEATKTESSKP
jgi:quercetin dioxygenase-like cupin family protein